MATTNAKKSETGGKASDEEKFQDAPEEEKTAKPKEDAAKAEESKSEDAKAAADTVDKAASAESAPPAIWEPAEFDVLNGRGASVNAHGGNKKFRAICFARKPEFDAGNHAAKRRIATEIVAATTGSTSARFLKKKIDKGPWYQMTVEQAILKACQVMRDYKRPDRLAIKEIMQQNGSARKRSSRQQESTPMLDTPIPTGPLAPIIENPFGVQDHDILCGRGAFVNGHIGNQRLRTLSLERKTQFDAGNYTEKRTLASEVVQIIKSLDPPGRFLKRAAESPKKPSKVEGNEWILPPKGLDGTWEELSDEKAIHKACQVMRDIDRPDRKDRGSRKKQKVGASSPTKGAAADSEKSKAEGKDSMTVLAETTAEKAAVEEAVAATEEALDRVLGAVPDATKKAAAMAADASETAVV